MDVSRIVRTQVTTGELDPPADLSTGKDARVHGQSVQEADVKAINDGKSQLLEVVKALGEYLTSTEDGVRLKGKPYIRLSCRGSGCCMDHGDVGTVQLAIKDRDGPSE